MIWGNSRIREGNASSQR